MTKMTMARTCDCTFNRQALLASDIAACFYCFAQFPPTEVVSWCDGEAPFETAICPYCCVDSVVGFNGPVDTEWLTARHHKSFD